MLCGPAARVEMTQVAVPAVKVPGFEQVRVAPPSAKLAVPVGTANPVTPVTVAVKVSEVPKADEAVPVVRATEIVGVALVTVCVTAVEGPAAP